MTISDLKLRLEELGLSPEAFAAKTPISNMTIRRLLQFPGETLVPEKHRVHIEIALSAIANASLFENRTGTLSDIVEQFKVDGAKVENVAPIHIQMKLKFDDAGREIKDLALSLWKYASEKKSSRTRVARSLAIGALLYFINPFDLIPDSLPVAGYLDDFAVMTLALAQIRNLPLKKSDL